jgi:hypothetical protein
MPRLSTRALQHIHHMLSYGGRGVYGLSSTGFRERFDSFGVYEKAATAGAVYKKPAGKRFNEELRRKKNERQRQSVPGS